MLPKSRNLLLLANANIVHIYVVFHELIMLHRNLNDRILHVCQLVSHSAIT